MAEEGITEEAWNSVLQERTAPPEENTSPPEAGTEEAPVAEAADAAPAPEATPAEADPYANLSPEVQAKLKRFDEIAATQSQLINELQAAKGRIGALQSQWDKARSQTAAAPTQTQVAAAAKDPEKWESLKKDFPEWGDAISEFVETRLGSLAAQAKGPAQEEIEQLVAQRTEAAAADLEWKFNLALVSVKHPNWKSDINTDDFKQWFAGQPKELQALANSRDGADAIRVLDLYYGDKAKPAASVIDERKQRQAAAAGVHKPSSGAVTSKRVEDMTLKELWDYEARRRSKAAA